LVGLLQLPDAARADGLLATFRFCETVLHYRTLYFIDPTSCSCEALRLYHPARSFPEDHEGRWPAGLRQNWPM